MTHLPANAPRFLRLMEQGTRLLALAAGGTVVVLAGLICIDIGARSLLRVSVQGTDELGGYVLALVGSFGLAFTLMRKGHPRIDLGLKLLPRALHGPLHVLAQAVLAAVALFMTYHAWTELAGTIRFGAITNTPLKTPLWVPQGLWVAGTATFAAVAVTSTLHGLWLLLRAPELVAPYYGPTTVQDDVDEAIGATAHPQDKD